MKGMAPIVAVIISDVVGIDLPLAGLHCVVGAALSVFAGTPGHE